MSALQIFTFVHVIISLVGVAAGFAVVYGFITNKEMKVWTAIFLAATILTSVTGFFFPAEAFTPGHAIGIISLVLLGIATTARYPMEMAGRWRTAYVVTAILSQYLNFFVLIVQSFLKIPVLHELAPTQTEPVFGLTQLVALSLFVALGVMATLRFHPADMQKAEPA